MECERISSLLPTIKCSTCGHEIEIARMADHDCRAADDQPPQPQPQAQPRGVNGGESVSSVHTKANSNVHGNDHTAASENAPSRWQSSAPLLNKLIIPPLLTTARSTADNARSTTSSPCASPVAMSSGSNSPFRSTFLRKMSSPLLPRPPSPDRPLPQDSAFPIFPTYDKRARPTPRRPSEPARPIWRPAPGRFATQFAKSGQTGRTPLPQFQRPSLDHQGTHPSDQQQQDQTSLHHRHLVQTTFDPVSHSGSIASSQPSHDPFIKHASEISDSSHESSGLRAFAQSPEPLEHEPALASSPTIGGDAPWQPQTYPAETASNALAGSEQPRTERTETLQSHSRTLETTQLQNVTAETSQMPNGTAEPSQSRSESAASQYSTRSASTSTPALSLGHFKKPSIAAIARPLHEIGSYKPPQRSASRGPSPIPLRTESHKNDKSEGASPMTTTDLSVSLSKPLPPIKSSPAFDQQSCKPASLQLSRSFDVRPIPEDEMLSIPPPQSNQASTPTSATHTPSESVSSNGSSAQSAASSRSSPPTSTTFYPSGRPFDILPAPLSPRKPLEQPTAAPPAPSPLKASDPTTASPAPLALRKQSDGQISGSINNQQQQQQQPPPSSLTNVPEASSAPRAFDLPKGASAPVQRKPAKSFSRPTYADSASVVPTAIDIPAPLRTHPAAQLTPPASPLHPTRSVDRQSPTANDSSSSSSSTSTPIATVPPVLPLSPPTAEVSTVPSVSASWNVPCLPSPRSPPSTHSPLRSPRDYSSDDAAQPPSASQSATSIKAPQSQSNKSDPGNGIGKYSKGCCRGCTQSIVGRSVSSADGRLTGRWHRRCFVCQTCRAPFPAADFYVWRDQPYCARHYHERNGSLCTKCDRGIEGHYVAPDAREQEKFHPHCFTCCECHLILHHDYFDLNGRIYCERHAYKHAASLASPPNAALAGTGTGTGTGSASSPLSNGSPLGTNQGSTTAGSESGQAGPSLSQASLGPGQASPALGGSQRAGHSNSTANPLVSGSGSSGLGVNGSGSLGNDLNLGARRHPERRRTRLMMTTMG